MTKAEIITEISLKTGIEKNQVQEVVESFFKVVRNNMADGRNVYFRGFGSFIIKKRAKKIARNISKNTAMVIDEHYIPAFKPAKTFVEKIKKSEAVKLNAAKRESEAKEALKES
jgi:DNA-binding protein HU-beta